MNNRLYTVFGVSLIVLTSLILALNLLKTSSNDTGTNSYVIPTQSLPKRTTGIITNTTHDSLEKNSITQELQHRENLTNKQTVAWQKFKEIISAEPIDNNDFAITYSEDLSQFFIQLKSAEAPQKLENLLGSDPELLDLYREDNYNLFNTSTISTQTSIDREQKEFDDYHELKYQTQLNESSIGTPEDVPNPTQTANEKDPSRQIEPAMNVLKSLMGFNLTLLPPSTPTRVPDQINQPIISKKSTPSNLDSLFTEAGNRVGTPPPLIKAVMAHECGVLLSETSANIQAWSQPGSGLPSTHKCYDGGVKKGDGLDLGPMQFYLPRYFEVYSQSVNQFGKYNRARPYVENIIDSVYASAYKLKLDSKSSDSDFSCLEVKRASWCYACGCSRYDNGNLNAYGCRFAPGLFQYLWGYYTIGKPTTSSAAC